MARKEENPRVPPRLRQVFENYASPLFFITFCTMWRRSLLADTGVHNALISYCQRGLDMGKAGVGRYVIMPEHVHLFVRLAKDIRLGIWVSGLKKFIGRAIRQKGYTERIWQPGFFDHLLRKSESYAEKWNYVRMNPVRKGLAPDPDAWPFQGEITSLEF